MRSVRFCTF